MKLKTIKLAGFKTFVDTTKLTLHHNLAAIVGPNGCGKSNIIDAIRWVMGESSAKQLRGEESVDVIFNGSTARKPVGLASIELTFDNTEGRAGGEYAKYAEIAIRRQITREGQSSYFLNGTRCRRRDVIDIFLGTGLGPRSYAIIEQGTIARLIESRPEELRQHIEEAAGISKYKERRKETEIRMQHTRENLQRLHDLREEIGKQLDRLEKQAQAAKQYKTLKQQERITRATLLATHWQLLDDELGGLQSAIQTMEYQYEQQQGLLATQENCLFAKQQTHAALLEKVNAKERANYANKHAISGAEQAIAHEKQRQAQLELDLQQINDSLHRLANEKAADREQTQLLTQRLQDLEPQLDLEQSVVCELENQLQQVEHDLKQWQDQSAQILAQLNHHQSSFQVQQTQIQHLERSCQANEQRQQRLNTESLQLNTRDLALELEGFASQTELVLNEQDELEQQVTSLQVQLIEVRAQKEQLQGQMQAAQAALYQTSAHLSSLQTLQQEGLGHQHNQAQAWLQTNALADSPPIITSLRVESGWEKAVEVVLGQRLQAIGVHELKRLLHNLSPLPKVNISLLAAFSTSVVKPAPHLLASKVQSPWALAELFAGIHIANSYQQAVELLELLAPNESAITPDGIWLSHHWLHVQNEVDVNTGRLARAKEIQQLNDILLQQEHSLATITANDATAAQQRLQLELQKEHYQKLLTENKQRLTQIDAQQQILQAQVNQQAKRQQEIDQDRAELLVQHSTDLAESTKLKQQAEQALASIEEFKQHQAEIAIQQQQVAVYSQELKQQFRQKQIRLHELKNAVNATQIQLEAKQVHLQRIAQQVQEYQQRSQTLQYNLQELIRPLANKHIELQAHVQQQLQLEQEFCMLQEELKSSSQSLHELELAKQSHEKTIRTQRDTLEQHRLQQQALVVRQQNITEKLNEHNYEVASITELLASQLDPAQLEKELEQLQKRVQRLGAINLAAIEEFQQQQERKLYLDAQHEDLSLALTTLQEAIAKIDKETKNRFSATFEKVNQGLQALFPKLFGGGEAYLQLTDDVMLEAGVSIMARPPGKRNSTIHLLSGGEKALTAVALVFAIFQLNPAPFCLLDEVDAPLDEANVARFCNLLKHMAQSVQFLFITHNKTTMEAAEQLIGVTMREPGVSKLVAVDVGQALELAQT